MTMPFELIPYSDTTYDPLILPDGILNFPGVSRKSQRVKLVAGDNYFHDKGVTQAREASVSGTVTLSQAQQLDEMMRGMVDLYFDDGIGVFKCFIKSAGSIVDNKLTFVLTITEELAIAEDYA